MLGTVISHYRIEEKLGEGGMGVVYRARDLQLNRPAAIKILSSEVASEERRRRFQQEAQLASSLNHPHILAVYEAGSVDDQQYLITELVDGSTLREWCAREKPNVRQVLELMTGIGDALACAHQAGIVHRDIKPENILVAHQGYAKLGDFGLAKLMEPERGEEAQEANTRTREPVRTRAGVVVGTVPYMAPEQLSGRTVDARADIYSFGVVLYELLAGRRPFAGATATEVIQSIVQGAARPLAEVRPEILAEVHLLVEKALEKDPGERYQSMRELVVDLKRAQRHRSAEGVPAAAATLPVVGHRWSWWVAGAAVLLLAAGAAAWFLERSDFFWRNPLANARFTRITDFEGAELDGAISRDGKFVAFLSDRDGSVDAWVSQIGTGAFHNLTKGGAPELSDEELRNVSFSAEGSLVCLWVRTRGAPGKPEVNVWAVPTMGGLLRPFLEGTAEAAWSPDGRRMVYHPAAPGDPLFVTEPNEKVGRQIYAPRPEVHCHYPSWSPDGSFIYFLQGYPPHEMDVWRIRPTGAELERITFHNSRVSHPTLLDSRTLLYVAPAEDGSGPSLYGMDVERRIPHRVSFGVEQYTSLAASLDGRRLVVTVAGAKASLWRVPISDRVIEESGASRVALPTVRALSPRLGPGYLIYLSSKGGADGVWKLEDGHAAELWSGREGHVTAAAAVSPDGQRIAFPVKKAERTRLYLMNKDGTGPRPLAETLDVRGAPAWSPDGKWIAVAAGQGAGAKLFRVPVDGGPPLAVAEEYSIDPVWSPDGRFLAYSGGQVGVAFPVKAVTVEGRPHSIQDLTLARGDRFRFLPGGAALVVLKGEGPRKNFWLLDLKTGGERRLTNFGPEYAIHDFDVSPDGEEIAFDRLKEASDIVLIDLPQR